MPRNWWPKRKLGTSKEDPGVAAGYRSGLEEKIAEYLTSKGVGFLFEKEVVEYLKPAKASRYTPDFKLPHGIFIETKGRFVTADRQKHILIKAQHPELDIRFLFSNAYQRISKLSKTTYAMWCDKWGFLWAHRVIPDDWLHAPIHS